MFWQLEMREGWLPLFHHLMMNWTTKKMYSSKNKKDQNIIEDGELPDETNTLVDTSNSEAGNADGTDTSTLDDKTIDNPTADSPITKVNETVGSSTDFECTFSTNEPTTIILWLKVNQQILKIF